MTPTVSVVTAVYNGEPYFDRAIPSILRQTFEDFEYIVVDDGSQDSTAERLRAVASRDARVRPLFSGRLGFVGALNFGIENAQGKYIARQDFDDVSYPQRLRLQVDYLDANPKVGVVGGHYWIVDDNREERYVRMPPVQHWEIVRAMARYIPFAHTLTTFRKSAWDEAGGYPVVDDIEDLRLWIQRR